MWTQSNPGPAPITLRAISSEEALASSGLGTNSSFPLKVYIHGFMDSGLDGGGIVRDLRKAYLKAREGRVNVVSVDWGKYVRRRDGIRQKREMFTRGEKYPRSEFLT